MAGPPRPALAAALLALLLVAWPVPSPAGAHEAPLDGGRPRWVEATLAAGLGGFLHAGYLGTGNPGDAPPRFIDIIGSGACWLDFDRDGWLDLYLVNQRYVSQPEKNARDPRSGLYRGDGDGTFTDVSAASGADLAMMGMGCAAADYDNDGDPDLLVTGWGGNALLRNGGDGTFADATAASGLRDARCSDFACWNTSASWLDADRDGCLDVFIGHFGDYDPDDPPNGNGPESAPGQVNGFHRGHCDGTFTPAVHAAGLGGEHSNTWSSVAADLDHDGWVDLYVSNDGDENDFYRNDGDGTFTRLNGTGLRNFGGGIQRHGMGTAVGDANHDGFLDLVSTNFVQEHNGVFLGHLGGWTDVGDAGAFTDAFPWSGWAAHWTEVDNDGRPDLVVVNGMTENMPSFPAPEPSLAFENRGGGGFAVLRDDLGPDFQREFAGRSGAWADHDNDGDVDLVLTEAGEAPTHLFRADRVGGAFLSVDLVGAGAGGRDALGAAVRVRAAGLPPQLQVKTAGAGFLGSHDPRLHFGLGAAQVAEVEVTWPDGAVEAWTGLRANAFVRLTRGQPAPEVVRELPLVALAGPASGGRLEPLGFTAAAVPGAGASIAGLAWDFGDGATAAGEAVTHAFDDVGDFTVTVTATDTLGRARSQTRNVRVTDALAAEVRLSAAAYLPVEQPRGEVVVRFSDGDPVRGAAVRLVATPSAGSATADAVLAAAGGAGVVSGSEPVVLDLVTGADGQAAFAMPWGLQGPGLGAFQVQANRPGNVHLEATGGARGSVFPPAEGRYTVGVVPLPDLP